MLIYLDNCCYNRPFDEQSQIRTRLETEAKLYIQQQIKNGVYNLVWSYMLDLENNNNPFWDRKISIQKWKNIANMICASSKNTIELGREIQQYDVKPKDALHIACAIRSNCDYFITTDIKLLKKQIPNIKIINPIDFVRKLEE